MPKPWYTLEGHLGFLLGKHETTRWRPRHQFRASAYDTTAPGALSQQVMSEAREEAELATVYFLRHQLNLMRRP